MKIKKLLLGVFSVWLMFCATPKPQAVVWDEIKWKIQICSWLENREMGYIRGHMNCLTRVNGLRYAIGIVRRYYSLWQQIGRISYKSLYDELHDIWGLDEEIAKSCNISKNVYELLKNLENMKQAYYSKAYELFLQSGFNT